MMAPSTVLEYCKSIPVGTIWRCHSTKRFSQICMKMAHTWALHCIHHDRVHRIFTFTITIILRASTSVLLSYFTIKVHRNLVAATWNIQWPMHPFWLLPHFVRSTFTLIRHWLHLGLMKLVKWNVAMSACPIRAIICIWTVAIIHVDRSLMASNA